MCTYHYSRKYENFAVLGNFNTEATCGRISNFLDEYNPKSIINSPTAFKSDNPKCIDLIFKSKHKLPKYYNNRDRIIGFSFNAGYST